MGWIAREAGVHPASLHATAATVQDRHDRVIRARQATVAELYAAAGLGGAAALDAATSGDAAHPLSRLRAQAAEGASTDPEGSRLLLALEGAEAAGPGDAPAVLARCSDELLDEHDLPLLPRRLTLRRSRTLAPFLLCAVPATLLVVFATSASA